MQCLFLDQIKQLYFNQKTFNQKKLLEAEICTTVTNSPLIKTRKAIDSLFNCTDQLKINEVNSILKRFKLDNDYQTIKEL